MGKKKQYNARRSAVIKDTAVSTADAALPSHHSCSDSDVSNLSGTELKFSNPHTEKEQESPQENICQTSADKPVIQETVYHNHNPVSGQPVKQSLRPYALAAAEQRKPALKHEKNRASSKTDTHIANSRQKGKETHSGTKPSFTSEKAEETKEKKSGRLQNEPDSMKKESKLKFDDTDTNGQPGMIGTVKKRAGKAVEKTVVAVSTYAHGKIHEAEHENSAIEGSHKAELLAEQGIRKLKHDVQSKKQKSQDTRQGNKLQESPSENTSALHHGDVPNSSQTVEKKEGLLNRFYQKRQNKKRAAEAMKKAKQGGQTAEKAFETAASATEQTIILLTGTPKKRKRSLYSIIAVLLIALILFSQLHSCSMMAAGTFSSVTSSSWPADDAEITKADLYYTELEAKLQQKIDNIESTYSGHDEYNYNIGEIGHDPVVLISYLSAKYGDFTFNQVKQELDRLFSLQYDLDIDTFTEQRAITLTYRIGDSLGNVVTSAYCPCSVCCGQWAGGPTASGVYPTANHTIAVDANNPFVPIGTKIKMNGIVYTVEDTGNFARYGVQFDVYHDDHASALIWGHRTYEAIFVGGSRSTIEKTTTKTVSICNVTLTSKSLQSIITSRLNNDQMELFNVYQSTRGNRQFLGTPFAANWYGSVTSYYGYRIHPISNNLQIHRGLDIAAPSGKEILAVHKGTVTTAAYDSGYGNYIVIENEDGYKTKYAHCSSLLASVGQTVETGDVIAKVGSTGQSTGPHLHIEFLYQNEYLNPYFYLGVGSGSLYGNGFGFTGDVDALDDATFAALIQEAEKYLGMAYVWGGSSPSTGFDCSGFVSYVFTNSGVYNMGRLTAQGIYDISSPVSPSDAKPGDIIFFKGTYDTSGVSHVGIYVGNGQMIHCGDPIQSTSINTAYWQSHFFAFGRVGQ